MILYKKPIKAQTGASLKMDEYLLPKRHLARDRHITRYNPEADADLDDVILHHLNERNTQHGGPLMVMASDIGDARDWIIGPERHGMIEYDIDKANNFKFRDKPLGWPKVTADQLIAEHNARLARQKKAGNITPISARNISSVYSDESGPNSLMPEVLTIRKAKPRGIEQNILDADLLYDRYY